MKITFDAVPICSDKMSGIGWCELGQTQALAKLFPHNQYEYSFFTSGDNERVKRVKQFAGKDIKLNTSGFSGFVYRAVSNFLPIPYSFFFGRKSDITHFFNYIVPPFVHGRKVVTVHDMVYKTFPETVRGRTRYMLDTGLKRSMKRADLIVTDSEFSKSEIIKYFPKWESKIRVVPCGVDLERFRPCTEPQRIPEVKKSLEIEGEYFLYVGTIEPRKNLERLMTAYAAFAKKAGENAPKLVLAGGKGWLDKGIYSRVEKLGMEKNIIFTKYVPSEDMNPLMCGALAFVFPSIYEGFGMPPLEAMACGVPVLTSGEASLPEVTGDCAVICDAYDVKSIAQGLYRLYSDEKLRKELSRRGLERAQGFTWERSAKMLMDVYRELKHE
ncbi:glycosyltransferase family 4 protein [Ruminococcus flavefaciens]|jgi:glycosyltransferase involved in cell wall biosynthesis|uniref:glycosyltransferase family 4 protein n=1 Tax=Ruminococcus flavefaciens TaxID=1265 RepID=UPI000465D133|nr:glycosyltransferase family 1 protein [Ruminococcus flavefaciens]